MANEYAIPIERIKVKIEVEKSKFVARIAPARTIEEARDYIKEVRAEYPNASHHVPAYIIGGGNQVIDYCSDDGEPSGTAGMPVLMALRGSGLGDVVVVVTRYFGGILLGKGGLVKAYTNAAQEVLRTVARGYPRMVDMVEFVVGYDGYEILKKEILKFEGKQLEEEFGVDVSLRCSIKVEDTDTLITRCNDIFAGKLIYEIIGRKELVFPERGESFAKS